MAVVAALHRRSGQLEGLSTFLRRLPELIEKDPEQAKALAQRLLQDGTVEEVVSHIVHGPLVVIQIIDSVPSFCS